MNGSEKGRWGGCGQTVCVVAEGGVGGSGSGGRGAGRENATSRSGGGREVHALPGGSSDDLEGMSCDTDDGAVDDGRHDAEQLLLLQSG